METNELPRKAMEVVHDLLLMRGDGEARAARIRELLPEKSGMTGPQFTAVLALTIEHLCRVVDGISATRSEEFDNEIRNRLLELGFTRMPWEDS